MRCLRCKAMYTDPNPAAEVCGACMSKIHREVEVDPDDGVLLHWLRHITAQVSDRIWEGTERWRYYVSRP